MSAKTICMNCANPAVKRGLCRRCLKQPQPTAWQRRNTPPQVNWQRSTHPLLKTKEWKSLKDSVLDSSPLCVRCALAGRNRLATEVDHIKPVRKFIELAFVRDNVQPLCEKCHRVKSGAEKRGYAHDYVNQVIYELFDG